jgi:RNA polymerase sigma factor (sigma-70 family)
VRGLVTLLALLAVAVGGPAVAAAPVRGHSERLAARARRGDRDARRLLVEEHLPLVRSIALRYRDLGLPVEDLVQEGSIGLLQAIDSFDPGCGASFSTYAFWRVRGAITHALTERGRLLRIPRPVIQRRRAVSEAQRRLAAAGRTPSVSELAVATGLSREEVEEALAAPLEVGSLDALEPSAAAALVDPAADPESATIAAQRAHAVVRAVGRLGRRSREVVSRHFGIGQQPETLQRIAADLALSPSRTRALKDDALRELAVALEHELPSARP